MRAGLLFTMLAAGLLGCASTSPRPAFDDVARRVAERSGHRLSWQAFQDARAEKAVDDLLARELTADTATQVALLESPALRSKLEELSIAQADLVQAGLLKNPVFTFGRTAWEQEHISPNLFGTIEQDFLDLLTMPLRKRVAAAELERTKLEVADHVLEVASDVRRAFYTAQAAAQVALVRERIHHAASTSGELARRQHEAGNLSDLALGTELTLAAQAGLDRKRSEGDAMVAREALNRHMGVWGVRTGWTMARLPELPPEEPDLERVESQAVAQRLDVAAARENVVAIGRALGLAKTTRWTGTVSVAVESGRLRTSRRFSFGPSVTVEIPLFDQRRAAIARLEAYERQAQNDLRALAIEVRADVRAARARVLTARAVVEQYGKVVVPLRESVVRYSQEQYDAMLLGVHQLIQAKQAEFETYREYIEALRDYWIARSDLERAVGSRIGGKS